MSHRVNMLTGIKEPKPSATERTWSRWRMRRNISTTEDKNRVSKIKELKLKALERAFFLKRIMLGKKGNLKENESK